MNSVKVTTARTILITVAFAAAAALSPATASADSITASNATAIPIADGSGAAAPYTPGAGSPYPSAISVSGLAGPITDVNVTLAQVSHTRPDDLDVMLEGPGGQRVVLLSDAGETFALTTAGLSFDDQAATQAPDTTAIAPGAYKPTNHFGGLGEPVDLNDPFLPPAPGAPRSATLGAAFDGLAATGTWNLYVVDDRPGNTGTVAGGWSLQITTGATPPPPPEEPPQEGEPPQVIEVIFNKAPEPGGAAVLTATVSDDTEAIEWDVNGDGSPEIVSEPDQTSFRFRPAPGQSTTVEVRAIGSGGASPVTSQVVDAPPAPPGRLADRILRTVSQSPPVYAVGSAETLTGAPPPPAACGSTAKTTRQFRLQAPTRISVGQLTLSGPMSPVESITQIPRPELGVVKPVAEELKIPPTKSALDLAVRMTDPFVGSGTVTLNEAASLVSQCNSGAGQMSSTLFHAQTSTIANSKGLMGMAGATLQMPNGVIRLPSSTDGEGIELIRAAAFARQLEQQNPELGQALDALGAELLTATGIGLQSGGGYIDATIKLPSWINNAGVSGQVQIRLDVRGGKVVVDRLQIGPLAISIGVVRVSEFQITYERAINEWRGQGKSCFVADAACLSMVPPDGQVRIVNGNLEFAGAQLQLDPGLPLGPGINLERIGFKFGLNPTRLAGNGQVSVAGFVVIRGELFLAFPSSSQPFVLRQDEFAGYPQQLYGRSHTSFTIGLSATAFLRLPLVGETELANAYFIYEEGGYVAFGARFDLSILEIASISGFLSANIDFSGPETIYMFRAGVQACLHFIAKICGGAEAAISRGRNGTGGAGVCFGSVGGGVQWPNRFNDFETQVFLYPPGGKSCPITRFIAPEFATADASSAAHVVRIDRGDPARAIRLDGADAPPRVRITAPDGQVLEGTSEGGVDISDDGALGIASFDGFGATADQNFTVVSINDPRPGRYEIELLEGSPAITKIAEADHPEQASATAEVVGNGERRVLRYEIGRRPGQRVTFYEVTADGTARAIGSVEGGGEGQLAFSPTPGVGERRIEAQFEIDGLPAERVTVADFKPPAPRLAKATNLRVRRVGASLRVSWNKVQGADRYEIALTTSDSQPTFTTRGTTTVLRRVPKSTSGRVSVRAVDTSRQGPPTSARFSRTAPPRDGFEPLPQCQLKQELVCRTR